MKHVAIIQTVREKDRERRAATSAIPAGSGRMRGTRMVVSTAAPSAWISAIARFAKRRKQSEAL